MTISRKLLAATFVASIGSASFVPPAQAAECTVSEKLVNSCRPWVGAASNNYVKGFRNSIEHHETRAGRRMEIVHSYRGPGQVLTSDDVYMATRPGTIGFFNYKPSTSWADAGGSNETVNAQIDKMADSIKGLGSTKVFFTVFHEPENDISSGGAPTCPNTTFKGRSGTTEEYVEMWHNVRARFDARGVENVVWVMNYMGWTKWLCVTKPLWPGNEYVDWVMWDPYPGKKTYVQFVSEFYNYLTNNSDATYDFASKPWGLAEYGYIGSSQAAAYQFYDDIAASIANNVFPKLRAYVNWDGKARHDNRVLYTSTGVKDQAEQDRYNALVHNAVFAGPA